MRDAPIRVRVVMARFHPLFGGHILQMRRCLPRLRAHQVEASVITAGLPGEPAREQLDNIGVRRLALPGLPESLRMLVFGVRVLVHLVASRRDWDVVHAVGTSWHTYACVAAARLLGKRSIVEMVLLGDDDPASLRKLPLGRFKLAVWRRADRIASLSSALTRAATNAGIAAERIPQIPVGVDTDHFRPAIDDAERRQLRNALNLPQDEPIVVFIGAITPRKGVELLVEAWPRVRAVAPTAQLVLLGPVDLTPEDRAFREPLVSRVSALHLVNCVHWRGRVEVVELYLRCADVFVLPSESEGLPNSVLEAMASGVAPVITGLPGIANDIVRSPDQGTLVESRTADSFAAALSDLLCDADRRAAIGVSARARIIEAFSIENRVERYAELYGGLAESARR